MNHYIYFVSPMCSWCWGFAPVIQKLKRLFPTINIKVVLTPFRINTNQPMDESLREYVMGQWHNVHKATGQPFDFNFSMPEHFVYNTRLACLSVKAFCKQYPEKELEYLHALQYSFYAENKNLTDENVLVEIAGSFSLNTNKFIEDLRCSGIVNVLDLDFDLCKQYAVQSYPTLMYKSDKNYSVVASGYTSYDELVTCINTDAVS